MVPRVRVLTVRDLVSMPAIPGIPFSSRNRPSVMTLVRWLGCSHASRTTKPSVWTWPDSMWSSEIP